MAPRVLVIGLDALDPNLVDGWLPELPTLRSLMDRGLHGPLESIVQPVTPAAWTAMCSGRDQGHFGFTDFTARVAGGYDYRLVHSRMVPVPTLATLLPRHGLRVISVGVPISYPPVVTQDGVCVACFMAPTPERTITYPAEIQAEVIGATSSPYLLDVSVQETELEAGRDELAARLIEFDRQRFDVALHLLRTRRWDLGFLVCMGTDRAGHYFMRYTDPAHGRHDADPRYADVMREQYAYCDRRIGELLAAVGDDCVVAVVSDHGMQGMRGRIALNDWLHANGHLVLREPAAGPRPLEAAHVDWERTRAWAHGYAGQVTLNLRGRDPAGCVDPDGAEPLLAEIEAGLAAIRDPAGDPIPTRCFRGRDLFTGERANACPDLLVQFDGCRWLTSDAVGHPRLVRPVTELGIDDASHAPHGFLALAGPGVPALGRFTAMHLLDVAPTLLEILGVPHDELAGQPLHLVDAVYSDEDVAELTNRLKSMYLQ